MADGWQHVIRLAAAVAGIIALSPVLLLAAASIRLTSRGPVLFHQERVGLHGRLFRVHKFRTMRADSRGPAITMSADARVTAVGAFLRRLKLDELPQLVNVLKGEMNFIGPRPEVPRYVAMYPEAVRDLILSVRPGLTDLASLAYIDESRLLAAHADPERYYVERLMPAKLRLAGAYVRDRNWWLDVRIVAATLTGILGWHWMPAPYDQSST